MANEEQLSWDDLTEDQVGETIEEGAVEDAESMGQRPHGRFLCTCEDSTPRQKNWEKYTALCANLKWRIDTVLGLFDSKGELRLPTDQEKDRLEGKYHYDDIVLHDPLEKDGMRKRRLLVAKRCGLITNTSGEIPKRAWAKDIIGKRAVLTTEKTEGKNKEGNPTGKFYVNVAFSGYESAENAGHEVTEDDYTDI
ncbi:MAG: hypothetical protein RBT11_19875 [Desulfobacterales bacterium]|jgi:hypothetical protein|nr:hypothetical protein [Desulfobacterales bacterium]